MVSAEVVINFTDNEWHDHIRARLIEDNFIKSAGADHLNSLGILSLTWGGAFEREATMRFRTEAQAMWFRLKYLGD